MTLVLGRPLSKRSPLTPDVFPRAATKLSKRVASANATLSPGRQGGATEARGLTAPRGRFKLGACRSISAGPAGDQIVWIREDG
jgi:hypothetical protein